MIRIFFIVFLIFSFTSCKSSKSVSKKTNKTVKTSKKKIIKKAVLISDKIIKKAKSYQGTKYKYGGNNASGMDCSGLVCTSFKSEKISLPRTTRDLSKTGNWVDLKTVQKGDLLFFATRKNSRVINHIGIVTSTKNNEVEFIHSTTSKGVITSLLKERYWYLAFVQARRVLK